jgi:transaldolase
MRASDPLEKAGVHLVLTVIYSSLQELCCVLLQLVWIAAYTFAHYA